MRRMGIVSASLLLFFLSITSIAGVAFAQSSATAAPTVNRTVYASGRNVDITGNVNGDIYCAGQDIVINANVRGDVMCAGQNINISGHVSGSVRLVGENVTVNASVGHSISGVAENYTFGSKASVGQDGTIVSQSSVIAGSIGRDASIRSNTLILSGKIGRNLSFRGSSLTLESQSTVKGSLSYTSTHAAYIISGAKVTGHIAYIQTPAPTVRQQLASEISSFIFMILALLLFALALVLVAPQVVYRVSNEAAKNLGKTILYGLAAMFILSIGCTILIISIIGAPLAIALFIAWMLMGALSIPVAANYVGNILLPKNNNAFVIMSMGCLALLALIYVPYVGALVLLLAYLVGSGAILRSLRHHLPDPEYRFDK